MAKGRILLECSNTWEGDVNTGIQRVVRNIVQEASGLEKDFNVEIIPVIVKSSRFCRAGKKPEAALSNSEYLYLLKKVYHKARPFLNGFPLIEKIDYFLVLYFRRFIASIFNIIFLKRIRKSYSQLEIIPGKGDILLLLDSSWMYPIWPAVEKAKNNGVIVGLVVYDIIPLTHPDFFPFAITKRFKIWFKQAVAHVDFFVGISETVKNEVRTYLKRNHPNYQDGRVGFFTLGCTLDNISKKIAASSLKSIPRDDTSSKMGNRYITVGTIEARKNHKYLLDTFDLVWQKCPDVSLCIIGKIGWLSDQVINRIKKHSLFQKNLFMFNNISDTELEYYYRHSKALIFPSFVEGFGLPIVEALHYGLPVLASDIPIHREVGKDFCAYFDLNDPACLAKIIIDIEKTGKMPLVRNSREYKPVTWNDSCRELFARIQALTAC